METLFFTISFALMICGQSAADWIGQPSFSSPFNTNNTCDAEQKVGFNWADLHEGNFTAFGSFTFSGFVYADSPARRDVGTQQASRGGYITSNLAVNSGNGPSFHCDSGSSGFSIDKYHVSVDRDTEIEFQYNMYDGSICRHVSACSSSGSIIQNSQCGGAKGVELRLSQESRQGCAIRVHRIDFHCTSGTGNVPSEQSPTRSSVANSSTRSINVQTALTTSVVTDRRSVSTSEDVEVPRSISILSTVSILPTRSSPRLFSTWHLFSFATSSLTRPARNASVTYLMESAYSGPIATAEQSTCAAINASRPFCHGSEGLGQLSTSPNMSALTDAPVESRSSTTLVANTSVYSGIISPPRASTSCPDVLPRCLSTWMHISDCKDNSDFTCFCKAALFTKNVMSCVSAWSSDKDELQAAMTYLIGICADYIPDNIGLLTDCPRSITIGVEAGKATARSSPLAIDIPHPSALERSTGSINSSLPTIETLITSKTFSSLSAWQSAAPATTREQAPLTTMTVTAIYTVQCTYSTGESQGLDIPGSSTIALLHTTVTAPRVVFATALNLQSDYTLYEAVTSRSVALVAAVGEGAATAEGATTAVRGAGSSANSLLQGSSQSASPSSTVLRSPAQFTGAAKTDQTWVWVDVLAAAMCVAAFLI